MNQHNGVTGPNAAFPGSPPPKTYVALGDDGERRYRLGLTSTDELLKG